MQPFIPSSRFHVYQGPHGAGTTHAMMEVVSELRKEGVKGVHYVSASVPLHWSLTKAFSMNQAVIHGFFNAVPFFQRETFEPDLASGVRLGDVLRRLGKSAKKYENGRVTTIIIDGVNKLVEQPSTAIAWPNEVYRLLEAAKLHSDDGVIHWILVDSSGCNFARDSKMECRYSSRMDLVFSRDVDEEDAKVFLKRSFEAAGKKFDVDEVYKCLTGGRIDLLKKTVDVLKKKPGSTSQKGGVLKAAVKRLFGIATHPKPADEDEAEAIKTQEDLFQSVLSMFFRDLKKVFSVWPHPKTPTEEYQYRILRLLAENPKGFEDCSSLRTRAGEKDFHDKEVDCDAAIGQLLKRDLLQYRNCDEFELHSNAIKYLVLKNERLSSE